MKKYYTKYLPVKERLNAGDFYQISDVDKNVSIYQCVRIENDRVYYGDYESELIGHKSMTSDNIKNCQKVKLFFCEYTIEIGDKCFYQSKKTPKWNGFCKIIEKANQFNNDYYAIELGDTRTGAYYSELIKVISEVSPEAIWVKDGDEFIDNDIKYGTYRKFDKNCSVLECPKDEWFLSKEEEYALNINDWHKCILIKGSCGHFH